MVPIGMSSTCVFPLGLDRAFALAKAAGFDGIEIMVGGNAQTRDETELRRLSEKHELPILSLHAPVLLFSHFVWGRDPLVKLQRTAELTARLGARSVVVHPPFRWQAGYAEHFERHVRETAASSGIEIAVENMFPWRVGGRSMKAYLPGWDPRLMDTDSVTLDFSHAALSGQDGLALAKTFGRRLRHIHLCDGSGSLDEGKVFDEHLLPGRGGQPIRETLGWLAERGWDGQIVAEIKTGVNRSDEQRLALLRETLEYAREALRVEHDPTAEPALGPVGA